MKKTLIHTALSFSTRQAIRHVAANRQQPQFLFWILSATFSIVRVVRLCAKYYRCPCVPCCQWCVSVLDSSHTILSWVKYNHFWTQDGVFLWLDKYSTFTVWKQWIVQCLESMSW